MAKTTEKRNKEKPKASSKSSKTSKRTISRKPGGNKSRKRSPESGDSDTDSGPAVKKQKKAHRSHGKPDSEVEVVTGDDEEADVEVVDDRDKSDSDDEVS